MAATILFVAVGIIAKVASATNAVPGPIIIFLLILGAFATIALLQAVMAFYRSGMNRGYLRGAGRDAIQEPLPTGELGAPRRWDFWAVLAFGATMYALLGYAGLHGAPH